MACTLLWKCPACWSKPLREWGVPSMGLGGVHLNVLATQTRLDAFCWWMYLVLSAPTHLLLLRCTISSASIT